MARIRTLVTGTLAVGAVFLLCWLHLKPAFGVFYSPDSYGYYLLGDTLVRDGRFASPSVRDLHAARSFPQPSRSFPPLWPLVVGLTSRLTGQGIASGVLANGAVLLASLAAVWRLGRRLAGGPGMLVFLAFPLFLLYDVDYQVELVSARAVPLALMILLLILVASLPWLDGSTLTRGRAAATGALLALLTLCRFDQMLFAAACLAAMPLRALGARPRQALADAGWAWLGFALLWLPWAVRNLVVFGVPMASDGSVSAASTAPGIGGLLYYAPGQAPPTLSEAPALWLAQRWQYFEENLAVIGGQLGWLLALAPLVIGLAWPRLTRSDRLLSVIMASSALFTVVAVSTTSFHDARYFSPIVALLAIFAALALCRLAAQRPRAILAATVAGWCLLASQTLGDAGHALRQHHDLSAAMSVPEPAVQADYAEIKPTLLAAIGEGGVVATHDAEAFAYYTGLRSMYLPKNVSSRDANFEAWLQDWHPDFIWAYPLWVQAVGLGSWGVEPRVVGGLLLLRVPPAAKTGERAAPSAAP